MSEPVLYNIPPSLCSQKVRLVLVEKGVLYRNRWMDIGPLAEHYEPWYVKLNPKCVVPTLVNGEDVVTDSFVIMRYVAERFDGPVLLPEDPDERSRMEHWYARAETLDFRLFSFSTVKPRLSAFGIQSKLKKLRAYAQKHPELRAEYEAKIEDITTLREQSRDPAEVSRRRIELEAELDSLDAILADQDFIAGSTYSLADVIWTVSLTRLDFLKQRVLLEERPALLAYFHRMQARPSYTEAMLYPSFKIRPMLPLFARVLGPKLVVVVALVAAVLLAARLL